MCKIGKRKSERSACKHVLIKVEICDEFRENMKKDDPDRRCFCSEEFSDMKNWEDRIEHDSWYRRVTACSNYDQEDHKNWREDKKRCKKWGRKGGRCEKEEEWNKREVIAKYTEGANKEPYNIDPNGKLKLARHVLSGKAKK
jgi:hypothetical protein